MKFVSDKKDDKVVGSRPIRKIRVQFRQLLILQRIRRQIVEQLVQKKLLRTQIRRHHHLIRQEAKYAKQSNFQGIIY